MTVGKLKEGGLPPQLLLLTDYFYNIVQLSKTTNIYTTLRNTE